MEFSDELSVTSKEVLKEDEYYKEQAEANRESLESNCDSRLKIMKERQQSISKRLLKESQKTLNFPYAIKSNVELFNKGPNDADDLLSRSANSSLNLNE